MRSLLFRHNLVLLKKVRRKLDGKWQQIPDIGVYLVSVNTGPHFYIICEPESEWYTKCRDNGLKKCIRCKVGSANGSIKWIKWILASDCIANQNLGTHHNEIGDRSIVDIRYSLHCYVRSFKLTVNMAGEAHPKKKPIEIQRILFVAFSTYTRWFVPAISFATMCMAA